MKNYTVIIPYFNAELTIQKLLNSIRKSIKKDYLVLLIDDHPEKVTFSAIEQTNQVKVLPSKKELWWVGSINLGIETLFNSYDLQDEDIVVFVIGRYILN